jgi:predicted metal-dependent HD superfamily phosphohydrolase
MKQALLNEHRWVALLKRLGGGSVKSDSFVGLTEAYSQPHRRYHNLGHITHCLAEFDRAGGLAERPNEVEVAIWLHDLAYDPRATDNEEMSAFLGRKILATAGTEEFVLNRVDELILATKHGQPPVSADAQLLLDIDLSILGQPSDVFDAYDENIRMEYSWVPAAAYGAGRSSVLSAFLNRPRLYFTDHFERLYGLQAKANMTRSLLALRDSAKGEGSDPTRDGPEWR